MVIATLNGGLARGSAPANPSRSGDSIMPRWEWAGCAGQDHRGGAGLSTVARPPKKGMSANGSDGHVVHGLVRFFQVSPPSHRSLNRLCCALLNWFVSQSPSGRVWPGVGDCVLYEAKQVRCVSHRFEVTPKGKLVFSRVPHSQRFLPQHSTLPSILMPQLRVSPTLMEVKIPWGGDASPS